MSLACGKLYWIVHYLEFHAAFVDAGSRYEVSYNSGVTHFLHKLAFQVIVVELGLRVHDRNMYTVREEGFTSVTLLCRPHDSTLVDF